MVCVCVRDQHNKQRTLWIPTARTKSRSVCGLYLEPPSSPALMFAMKSPVQSGPLCSLSDSLPHCPVRSQHLFWVIAGR